LGTWDDGEELVDEDLSGLAEGGASSYSVTSPLIVGVETNAAGLKK
jgi:hypothetical protein